MSHIASHPAQRDGLVFASSIGTPIYPNWASKRWTHVRAAADMQKPVRFHDLRHTAIDLMYEAGVAEDLIMEMVGHSSAATTRGYRSAASDPRKREAMALVSSLIGS